MTGRRTSIGGRGATGVLLLLAAAGAMAGCYEKVTRVEGFGAHRISTESPNRQQGPIDELIFGKDQKPVRQGPSGAYRK